MMVPGSNLYALAATVIAQQLVQYYQDNGRTTNTLGLDVTAYLPAVDLRGSVQAVPRSKYEQLGLDMQKNYITFYTMKNVLDLERDVSGDQIVYAGVRYECISANDWFAMDGWVGVLCAEIGPA